MCKNCKKWSKGLIPCGQRGAVSIEYIGLAAVVVAIIAALILMAGQGGIGDALGGAVQQAIAAVSGGGDSTGTIGKSGAIEAPEPEAPDVQPPDAGDIDTVESPDRPEDFEPTGNPKFDNVDSIKKYVDKVKYRLIHGEAFIRGDGDDSDIHPSDINQGRLGDCYLLASLGAISDQDPEVIRRIIKDNGDGTYTVTLYRHRNANDPPGEEFIPVTITIDEKFPATGKNPVFAKPGDKEAAKASWLDKLRSWISRKTGLMDDPIKNEEDRYAQYELWPMLIEKAYAELHGSYGDIHGGRSARALESLTGIRSETTRNANLDFDQLANQFEEGQALVAASLPKVKDKDGKSRLPDLELYKDGTLLASHGYYITNVDRGDNEITLQNPHGWGGENGITMSFDEFKEAFNYTDRNSLR